MFLIWRREGNGKQSRQHEANIITFGWNASNACIDVSVSSFCCFHQSARQKPEYSTPLTGTKNWFSVFACTTTPTWPRIFRLQCCLLFCQQIKKFWKFLGRSSEGWGRDWRQIIRYVSGTPKTWALFNFQTHQCWRLWELTWLENIHNVNLIVWIIIIILRRNDTCDSNICLVKLIVRIISSWLPQWYILM